MRSRAHLCLVEVLETRIAPATLDLVGGVLTYTASAGVQNLVHVIVPDAATYIITSNEPMFFVGGMVGSGYSGDGTTTVVGSNDIVDGLNFQLGDLDDLLFVDGLTDALTVDGEAGSDTIFFTNPATPGDNLLLKAETINFNAPIIGAATVELKADDIALSAALSASERVTIVSLTPGRAISLGAEVAGSLSLTDAELDLISTPDVLAIGDEFSGAITIGGAVSIASAPTLSLHTGAGISQTAALSVANLRASTNGDTDAIALTHASNDVDTLAASAKGDLSFTDADDLQLGTVDGLAGLAVTGLASAIVVKAGATTQTAAADIIGAKLALTGAGPFTLTNAGNNVATFAANVSGVLSYTDADALSVGTIGSTAGVKTGGVGFGGGITLSTVDGDLTITDTALANDLEAVGSHSITLSVGAGKTLTVESGANVRSTPDIFFNADNVTLDGMVFPANAFLGGLFLQPVTAGREIALGAEVAGKLSLTNAELAHVSGAPVVGSAAAGAISIEGAIDLPFRLLLRTGAGVTSAATIAVNQFGVIAAGDVVLTGANAIREVSATLSGSAAFTLENSVPLALGFIPGQTLGITTAGGAVTLVTDSLDITSSFNDLDAGVGRVSISPRTAGRAINLGTTTGALDLSDAELDLITAGTLALSTSGTIDVSSALTPANLGTLALTGGEIGGTGSIAVPRLALDAAISASLAGANDVDFLAASSATLGFVDADGFTIAPMEGLTGLSGAAPALKALDTNPGAVTFDPAASLSVTIAGPGPGTGYTQLRVTGPLDLNGAALVAGVVNPPSANTPYTIIDNQGAGPITGTFAGLAEGASVTLGAHTFYLSYVGGDGNDVVLSVDPLVVTLGVDKKSATFTDVDGDLVTVRTTKGMFDGSEFIGIETGANGAGQLQKLALGAGFAGGNITITAKRTANGGNGLVNVGYIDATGVDLGTVSVAGDLGRIDAGTVGGSAAVPALKSLTVQSIGLLGLETQPAGGSTSSVLEGALPKLTVKNDLRGRVLIHGATDGRIGLATVGGSIAEGTTGNVGLQAEAGFGTLTVGGDIRGDATLSTAGAIGAFTVTGSITGSSTHPVTISAFGQLVAPTKGLDLAIRSISVLGSVEFANIFAGVAVPNADASIGSITVSGDWIGSSVLAGANAGDGLPGNNDDAKVTGGRDNAALFSTIGSFTLKGQALGTAEIATDMFGIVAERIGKAKIGTHPFPFANGVTPEFFFAAPTGPGAGAENPIFDFTLRELGSNTPGLTLGGPNLTISLDGKSATFTDVDGDLVMVKRTVGAFVVGDFGIITTASGGGQLQQLTVSPAPDNAVVSLTITVKTGAILGNGFVNVGAIVANGVPMGAVSVTGDLGSFSGGAGIDGQPGVKSLAAHSIGVLCTTTGASSLAFNFVDGIGALTVAGDVRDAIVEATGAPTGNFGAVTIGGSLLGAAFLHAAGSIGAVKISGSVRGGAIEATAGSIGAMTIGGDLTGGAAGATLSAFGLATAPTKGADLAIKSLSVKGNVENARIELGANADHANADASIGAVSIGRSWIASSLLAGVHVGADTFAGTDDDTKATGTGSTRDRDGVFSTIASITIKGQALGTAVGGDSFGIVVEQITKATLGVQVLTLDPGARDAADAFAVAPTGPGATGLRSDFFLREVIA